MKAKATIGVFSILLSFVGQCGASDSDGRVIDYWTHYSSSVFFFSVENQIGRPPCASFGSPSGRYVIDTSTDRGKAVLATIIAAKASGQRLHAEGANTCNFYGDSEDLLWVHVY